MTKAQSLVLVTLFVLVGVVVLLVKGEPVGEGLGSPPAAGGHGLDRDRGGRSRVGRRAVDQAPSPSAGATAPSGAVVADLLQRFQPSPPAADEDLLRLRIRPEPPPDALRNLGVEVIGSSAPEGSWLLVGRGVTEGVLELRLRPPLVVGPEAGFDLVLDAPTSLPERLHLAADEATRSPTGTRLWERTLELTPARLLRGRVVEPDGRPARDCPVALNDLTGEEVGRAPLDRTRSGVDGSFELRAAVDRVALITACREDGPPAWLIHRPGEAGALADLVLEPGLSIAGRIVLDGAGDHRVRLACDRLQAGTQIGHPARPLAYAAGRVTTAAARVETADLRFCFSGLGPGDYRLSLDAIDGASCTPELRESVSARVRAPADGLVLGVEACRLEFLVRAAGRPLGQAGLRLTTELGTRLVTDDEGRAGAWAARDQPFEVAVAAPGFEASGLKGFLAPDEAARQLVFDLRPDRRSAALEVELTVDGDRPPDAMTAVLAEPSRPDRPLHVRSARVDDDGVYRFSGLPTGRWSLRLRAGTEWARAGFLLDQVREIDLVRAGASLRLAVATRAGGRLSIQVLGPSGRPVPARLELRGPDGLERTVSLRLGDTHGAAVTTRDLVPAGRAEIEEALPAGRYQVLVVDVEGRSARSEVEVEAGRRQELELRFGD